MEAVESEAPPPSREAESRVVAELRRFLGSRKADEGRSFVRGVIIVRLGSDIEPELLDELLHLAITRCLEAKSPPWLASTVRPWVARCTRRAIAEYFRSREDDEENLEPGADPEAVFDRHLPSPDWGARAHLINKWLHQQLKGDPFKEETFRLMMAHEVEGWSLAELAEKHGTTTSALSNRFFKLRQQLIPRVRTMDDEKKRMFVFFLLFLGAFVALVVAYLLFFAPPPPRPPHLPPAPTHTFTEPTFDQAEPPPREEFPTKR